jgi:phage-related protein
MRRVIRSREFDAFFERLPSEVQEKMLYALTVISDIKVVSTKLIKKLVGTEFYELRISMKNEYRVILLAVDSDSFIESGQVLLLNGFVKKSTKDYRKEVDKARRILNLLETNNI